MLHAVDDKKSRLIVPHRPAVYQSLRSEHQIDKDHVTTIDWPPAGLALSCILHRGEGGVYLLGRIYNFFIVSGCLDSLVPTSTPISMYCTSLWITPSGTRQKNFEINFFLHILLTALFSALYT